MNPKQKRRKRLKRERTRDRRSSRAEVVRVMRALDAVVCTNTVQIHAIVEKLKQCPEAFKAGEMISKMFEALKYDPDAAAQGERYLPPAGAVMPPLV
jgi:hypothetical protein